jgi:hypothetical protein
MSRRRISFTRSGRHWSQTEAKLRQQRLEPPPVTVSYRCPICGEGHTRAEHAAPGTHGLTDDQLQDLRASAVDELINALRHNAPAAPCRRCGTR